MEVTIVLSVEVGDGVEVDPPWLDVEICEVCELVELP